VDTSGQRYVVKYQYNELNQLVRIQGKDEVIAGYKLKDEAELHYDARGNMLRIQSEGKNIGEYIYDAANRLIRTTTHTGIVAAYAYDGAGRRLKKEIGGDTYDYMVDMTTPYNDVLYVRHENQHGKTTLKYLYGNKLFGAKEADESSFYLHDEMGSPIRVMGNEGNSLGVTRYDTFGRPNSYGDVRNDARGLLSFTGYEDDRDTGLMYVDRDGHEPVLLHNMMDSYIESKKNSRTPPTDYSIVIKDDIATVYVYYNGVAEDIYTCEGTGIGNNKFVTDSSALEKHFNMTIEDYSSKSSFKSQDDAAIAFQLAYGLDQNSYNNQAAIIYRNSKGDYKFAMPGPFKGSLNTGDISTIDLGTGDRILAYVYTVCADDVTNNTDKPLYYMNGKVLRAWYKSNGEFVGGDVADLDGVSDGWLWDAQWIPSSVLEYDGLSDASAYFRKYEKNFTKLGWDQEKINALWQATIDIDSQYGIQIDPRLLLAIIIQEGTGSFNTSSTNLAADGQHGVETNYAVDLMKANSLIFGKILGYVYYGEDFSQAVSSNNNLSGISGNGNVFQYCNWSTPIIDTNRAIVRVGPYAGHGAWGDNVMKHYIALGGDVNGYENYLSGTDKKMVEKIAKDLGITLPSYSFVADQNAQDSKGNPNGDWTIKVK